MNQLIITPASREEWLSLRAQDLTSSEISALFGCCPYLTKFELWHRKKDGLVIGHSENKRMKWGNRLEDAIANGVAEDNGWRIRPMKEYIRLPDLRIGSSFDYRVWTDTMNELYGDSERDHLLEIKNVDYLQYRDKWIVDKSDNYYEAPPHIEFQAQHQMLVSGLRKCHIAAFIGGNDHIVIEREPNQQVFDAILEQSRLFWQSIADNRPPEPDFARDIDLIMALSRHAEPGKIFNAEGNSEISALVKQYIDGRDMAKAGDKLKDESKARLVLMIGDAEKVLGDGFSISAGMVGPATVSYEREGYRNFRVYEKKKK